MNEKKRRVDFQGFPLDIQIERGDSYSGVGEDGKPWAQTYQHPYGEIADTLGVDGDPVDIYLGPDETSDVAFVVFQLHLDGSFDEHKVMLGFPDEAAAVDCYDKHGPAWGRGAVQAMGLDELRAALPDMAFLHSPAARAQRGEP